MTAAHVRIHLALLPSGPDAVRRLKLHRFRTAVQSAKKRVYYTGTCVASRMYFARSSPTTTVNRSTYSMPVADWVERIFAVSHVRYDSTAGPSSPNSMRCQKKIPSTDM